MADNITVWLEGNATPPLTVIPDTYGSPLNQRAARRAAVLFHNESNR
jgi:hypothetical protein